jgi:hypothetical protein
VTETDLTARMAGQTVRGERESLRVPDGRRLTWTLWGPMDGRPVLFCTGRA